MERRKDEKQKDTMCIVVTVTNSSWTGIWCEMNFYHPKDVCRASGSSEYERNTKI